MFLTFAFVIVLVFIASRMFTKYVKSGTIGMRESKFMRIIDTIAVGQDRYILIVEINSKYYLVGSSGSEINILTEFDGADMQQQLSELKNPAVDIKSFSTTLMDRMKKK